PSLIRARDKAELTVALTALAGRQQDLAHAIDTLASTADGGEAARTLEADAAAMKRQLDEIAATVDRRLAATTAREGAVRAIEAAHHAFAGIVVPLLDDAAFDMTTALSGDGKSDLA